MKLSQRNKMKLVSTSIGLMLCSSLLYSNCSPQGFQTLNPVSGTTLASSSGSGGSPGGGNPPDTGSGGTPAGAGSGMPTPTPPPPMGGGNPPPASGGTPTAPITQFATITGCANPMIGVNGDTGTRTSAIFVDVNNMRPANDPTYSKNAIFWTSRQNKPGQSVLMSGAFTGNKKTVRLAALKAGDLEWQTAVRASTTTVAATNMSSTGIAFTIPANWTYGTYAYRIEDANSSVPALEGLVNQPEIQWMVGTPSSEDVMEAPAHQMYDCGAELGGKLRIFGKNIRSSGEAYLQSSDNYLYPLSVDKSDD